MPNMSNDQMRAKLAALILSNPSTAALDANMLDASMGLDNSYVFGADSPQATDTLTQQNLSTLQVVLFAASGTKLSQSVFNGADLAITALPTGITSPDVASYRQIIRYFMANASQLRSLQITSSESSSSAPQLLSMGVTPTRSTPFLGSNSNTTLVSTAKTPQDYQQNMATFSLAVNIDTITYLNFTTGVTASADTTFTVTFFFGQRQELRAGLPTQVPQIVLAQNGAVKQLTATPVASPVAGINPAVLGQIKQLMAKGS